MDYTFQFLQKEKERVMEMMDSLDILNENNAEDIVKQFKKTDLLNFEYIPNIISYIFEVYVLQPHRTSKYISLLDQIKKENTEFSHTIESSLLENISLNSKIYTIEMTYFTRELMRASLILSINHIISITNPIFMAHLYYCCYDLLKDSERESLLHIIKNHEYTLRHIISKFDEYVTNNIGHIVNYYKYGFDPYSYMSIIIDDDVAAFQNRHSNDNIPVLSYQPIQSNLQWHMPFDEKTKYYEAAAAFGSVKIFKFLTMDYMALNDIGKFAIFGGSLEIIRISADRGATLELIDAVQYRKNLIIKWIIENSEITEKQIRKCFEPAILNNSIAFLQELKISSSNYYDDKFILHSICKSNNYHLLSFFTEFNYNLFNRPDKDGNTPLHCAAINGSSMCIQFFLTYPQVEWNPINKEGYTPLECAILNGHTEIVMLLISNPAIDKVHRPGGISLLALALKGGNDEIVEMMVNEGIYDKTDKYSTQYSIQAYACVSGNINWVKLFFKNIDDLSVNISDGFTALHLAASQGHTNLVKWMIEDMKLDPSIRDNNQKTALHIAVEQRQYDVIKYLALESEIDINARNFIGETALMNAVILDDKISVEIILQNKNVDRNLGDYFNGTPKTKAKLQDIMKILEEK